MISCYQTLFAQAHIDWRLSDIITRVTAPGTIVEVVLAPGDDNRAMSAITYSIALIVFLFAHCLEKWINRLETFYKAIYNLSALTIPFYFAAVQRLTRHFRPLHFVIPSARTTGCTSAIQSYFPRTIGMSYLVISNNLHHSQHL